MGKFLSVNLLGYNLKSERLYFLEVFYRLKILDGLPVFAQWTIYHERTQMRQSLGS